MTRITTMTIMMITRMVTINRDDNHNEDGDDENDNKNDDDHDNKNDKPASSKRQVKDVGK